MITIGRKANRRGINNYEWCARWERERRLQSRKRRADLVSTVDAATVVYSRHIRDFGYCVIEWRGTVQPFLKFMNNKGE